MKTIFILINLFTLAFARPKVLHLTFHEGCAGEVAYLCKMFDLELDTWNILQQPNGFLDPIAPAKSNYLMLHDKAERIFQKHKETFESYDLIITSDISPLSRIFLQNNWKKPLLIWVCNRFDINTRCSGFKEFPDAEYLKLFQEAGNLENVEIVGYANFEKVHAEKNRAITSIKTTIPPTGMSEVTKGYHKIPEHLKKEDHFFVRNYINEKSLALTRKLKELGMDCYCGTYAGSVDLKDFKGMIHVPGVMGNFHLWENIHQGIIHFIPSKTFYETLYTSRKIKLWDWCNPTSRTSYLPIDEVFANCDWYNEKLSPLFIFFDSFEDLKQKTEEIDYTTKKEAIISWHRKHVLYCLESWAPIFNRLLGTELKTFTWEGDEINPYSVRS